MFEPHRAPGAGPRLRPGPAGVSADELRRRPDRHVAAPTAPRRRRPSCGRSRDWRAREARRLRSTLSAPGARSARYLDRRLRAPARAAAGPVVRSAAPRRIAVRVDRGGPAAGRAAAERRRRLRRGARRGRARSAADCGRRWQRWEHAAALIPAVFPVERLLPASAVAPGSAVAIRGFALTMIDAALALTEGRGGALRAPRTSPAAALRARRRHDAAVIVPFSRSGRPMLAKPEPGCGRGTAGSTRSLRCGRRRIRALPGASTSTRDLDPDHRVAATAAAERSSAPRPSAPAQRRAARAGAATAPRRASPSSAAPRRRSSVAGDRRRAARGPTADGRWATTWRERVPGHRRAPRRRRADPTRRGRRFVASARRDGAYRVRATAGQRREAAGPDRARARSTSPTSRGGAASDGGRRDGAGRPATVSAASTSSSTRCSPGPGPSTCASRCSGSSSPTDTRASPRAAAGSTSTPTATCVGATGRRTPGWPRSGARPRTG